MTEGVRPERVSEEFREILAEEIPKLKDPRVGFVTVIGVDVTPDLRRATVYYTVMGEERERKATEAALRSARSHLRSVIGRQVRMKFLPDLEFRQEQGITRTDRVEELLREIHRGARQEEDDGAAG
jgi:ribosome-binding factor A